MRRTSPNPFSLTAIFTYFLLVSLWGCTLPGPPDILPYDAEALIPTSTATLTSIPPSATAVYPATWTPAGPLTTPTPDSPRQLPTLRSQQEDYHVQPNDTLAKIALRYGVTVQAIVNANQIPDPNLLKVGQYLVIPPPIPQSTGSDFKILPDSMVVFGPGTQGFDIASFVNLYDGYLNHYSENIDGEVLSGAQIVEQVALNYSINPRLLLAVIEYKGGWVTQKEVSPVSKDYPAGWFEPTRKGLYKQLYWAANVLSSGYYLWRVNALANYVLTDGSAVPVAPTLNAGTVAIQMLMSQFYIRSDWDLAVSNNGLFKVFSDLFGYPFDHPFEPEIPPDLQQPPLQLPFEPGQPWSFTGGPHGGWNDGTAWAALDFAPPGDARGCVRSDAWVVASADGIIVRSDHGAVVEDLDGDGLMQTGWDILYMHIDSVDRVSEGMAVKAGDRIGHPSCEGGVSNGTHVHLARRYNGEWISADGPIPFNLDGWISAGTGIQYNGYLRRDGQVLEAWDGRRPENQIQR